MHVSLLTKVMVRRSYKENAKSWHLFVTFQSAVTINHDASQKKNSRASVLDGTLIEPYGTFGVKSADTAVFSCLLSMARQFGSTVAALSDDMSKYQSGDNNNLPACHGPFAK